MIRAGALRHRVAIQRLAAGSPQRTPTGSKPGSWETFLSSIAASIDPVTGREPFLAQQHLSEVTTKIGTRYHSGITSAMRVVWGSRIFDIKAVLDDQERRRKLTLLCTEGTNSG